MLHFFLRMIFLSFAMQFFCTNLNAKNKNTEKPFVIGSLLGQLGNKLFEVATTCAVAWDNGADPFFPDFAPIKSQPDFKHIFFRCNTSFPKQAIRYEYKAPTFKYNPIPYHPNMRISGYCQNFHYFSHHRECLLKLFAPSKKDLDYITTKYFKIFAHPESVSVHVRYYLREKSEEPYFIQYDKKYYEKAMDLFPNSALFIITSDNLQFAKKNIPTKGRNVIFIEKEEYWIDFFIQSMCKHNIICNSTFSWWSAWLNQNPNKIVVRPNRWLGCDDIECPENWIRIESEGIKPRQRS